MAACLYLHAMNRNRVISRLKPRGAGHFIRHWREHRNLTLNQLSDRTGLSNPNLSKIERGLIPYTQRTLELLADALNCSPADLLMRNPNDPEAIWTIWEQLKPEDRIRILSFAKALKSTG